jgi:OOP family OmpA-OmpF porin
MIHATNNIQGDGNTVIKEKSMSKFTQAALGLVAGCMAATSAQAAGMPDDYVVIDLFAVQHEERVSNGDLGFGGRVGIGSTLNRGARSSTGIEFGLFANPIEDDISGDQAGIMIDLVQTFLLDRWTPYLFAGIGGTKENIGPVNEVYTSFEVGGGLLFDVGDSMMARVGLSAMSVRDDELRADYDAFVDYRFNVGLIFGGRAAAAPAAAPARAVDSDGDGLADDQDRCPTTPASTMDGCPPAAPVVQTDSDGDGVYDSADNCPGTLEGLKVDASGCAVQDASGEKQSVVLKGVTFLPGSATLTEDAKGVLDGAAAAFNGQKDLKAEIGGHTDAQGSDAANQKLSQRRADSVRQYLLGKGVEAERLTAVGYGEAQPIATNDTPAGRAENRRVEFKLR